MSQSLVSVVIPVYNGEQYLAATVNSILTQQYQNIELILVDDGSKDNSKELIKKLALQDPRIKPFFNQNGGVAHARNYGIAKSQAEFIAFCDQDDLWLPEKLTKQMPLFDNSNVGLVYCGAIADYESTNTKVTPNFEGKFRGDVFDQLVRLNMLTCCTAVARKSYLTQVDNFDDDRELMGVDDWHLWLKLSMVCEFDFVEEHLAIHVFHEDNYSSNDEKMHHAELICLEKIALISKNKRKVVDWADIKQKIHLRYAESYLYFGLYHLGGRTLIRAHNEKSNYKYLLKGYLFCIFPETFWKFVRLLHTKIKN